MITLQAAILLFSSLLIAPVNRATSGAEETILAKAREALQQQEAEEHTRFKLEARWIPGSLRTLSKDHILSVQPAGPIQKYSSFEVIYTEHGQRNRAEVSLHVIAEKRIPVLTGRMERGEMITEEDLTWRWITIDLNREAPISEFEKMIGKTLRKTLNAGQFITADDIGRAFLIEAGDDISMIFRENGLEISLGCEARQDGALKEEIQVYCKETRKKYLARIKGPGETAWLKTQ